MHNNLDTIEDAFDGPVYEYLADGTWERYPLPKYEKYDALTDGKNWQSFMKELGFHNETWLSGEDMDSWGVTAWSHNVHGRLFILSGNDCFLGNVICRTPPAALKFIANFVSLFTAMNAQEWLGITSKRLPSLLPPTDT